MLTFLALAHIVDATQRMGGVVVGWWGCDVKVPCTCTHCRCYATHGVGLWSSGRFVMLTFLALAHIVDATQRMGWGCGRVVGL